MVRRQIFHKILQAQANLRVHICAGPIGRNPNISEYSSENLVYRAPNGPQAVVIVPAGFHDNKSQCRCKICEMGLRLVGFRPRRGCPTYLAVVPKAVPSRIIGFDRPHHVLWT
jgi:hypothetical protein